MISSPGSIKKSQNKDINSVEPAPIIILSSLIILSKYLRISSFKSIDLESGYLFIRFNEFLKI